jgi:formamidopyrimidine-DNA glycosylase
MPELAEVEHSRRLWLPGLGRRVVAVETRFDHARPFRGTDVARLRAALTGQIFRGAEAIGKQLCFRFGGRSLETADRWLGLHLGMAGRLSCERASYVAEKHDLLILRQRGRALVFTDLRHFGRVLFHEGLSAPPFWSRLPVAISSPDFTVALLTDFLTRRPRTPLKPLLLLQERFPGVGNWMADEILWRARLAPSRRAGDLDERQIAALYRALRWVCREAITTMSADWEYPESWLFAHRWQEGGRCPRCRGPLTRVQLGGRTTCSCRRCQPEPLAA